MTRTLTNGLSVATLVVSLAVHACAADTKKSDSGLEITPLVFEGIATPTATVRVRVPGLGDPAPSEIRAEYRVKKPDMIRDSVAITRTPADSENLSFSLKDLDLPVGAELALRIVVKRSDSVSRSKVFTLRVVAEDEIRAVQLKRMNQHHSQLAAISTRVENAGKQLSQLATVSDKERMWSKAQEVIVAIKKDFPSKAEWEPTLAGLKQLVHATTDNGLENNDRETTARIVRLIVDLTLQSHTCESIGNSLSKAQTAKGFAEAQPEIKASQTAIAGLTPKLAASQETLAKISDYCELLRQIRELLKQERASKVSDGEVLNRTLDFASTPTRSALARRRNGFHVRQG